MDAKFVDAIFDAKDKFKYSPVVLYTKSQRSTNYLLGKLSGNGVKICSSFINPTCDETIAFLLHEQIQEDIVTQEQLVLLLDSVKDSRKTIFLITCTSINNLKLIGRLRARLLSGVYAEI